MLENFINDAPFEVFHPYLIHYSLPFSFEQFLPSFPLFFLLLQINAEAIPIDYMTAIFLTPMKIQRLSTTSTEFSTLSHNYQSHVASLQREFCINHIWAVRSPSSGILLFESVFKYNN